MHSIIYLYSSSSLLLLVVDSCKLSYSCINMMDCKGATLLENDILVQGQYLESPLCKHTAHLDDRGNLVLCVSGGFGVSHRYWTSSHFKENGTFRLKLSSMGELSISSTSSKGKDIWKVGIKPGVGPYSLSIRDDCNLVVVDDSGNIAWESGTSHPRVWQCFLAEDLEVVRVSMPGTHNSKAHYGGAMAISTCQDILLPQQLLDGIRFLDIRARQFGTGLPLHHGPVYQHSNFHDVLVETTNFLSDHPTEFILMRLRDEYPGKGSSKTFSEIVDEHVEEFSQFFFEGTSLCDITVHDVRGKIILLRSFDHTKYVPYKSPMLTINDHWTVWLTFTAQKLTHITNNLTLARDSTSGGFLTYTSGATRTIPCMISGKVNRAVVKLLKEMGCAYVGILAMDFYLLEAVKQIVSKNGGCEAVWR